MKEEVEYKYILIVSQYYHDYHYFIVNMPEKNNYIKVLREFTVELDKHKSNLKEDYSIEPGDPFYYKETDKIYRRYNVNSYGDIYFINTVYANKAQEEIQAMIYQTTYERQGFKKKSVLEEIRKNHRYEDVAQIVKKYFEIA